LIAFVNQFSVMNDSDWISQAEAARIRGVSRQAIARLIARGRLKAAKIGGHRVVRRADIVKFVPRAAGRPEGKKKSNE